MIQNLQRIQIKILTDSPASLKLEPFLEIFARWRTEKDHPAEWVDLADYAHVPRGPGVMLIGKRCSISFDLAGPAPGILYAAKKGLSGSSSERIESALIACLEFSGRLLSEPEFPKSVHLRTDAIEIRFNDRLETPNDPATHAALQSAVKGVVERLYGGSSFEMNREPDPQLSYGFFVRAQAPQPLALLLSRFIATPRTP